MPPRNSHIQGNSINSSLCLSKPLVLLIGFVVIDILVALTPARFL
jgi:hypothetical protein